MADRSGACSARGHAPISSGHARPRDLV
jgi:hypothetical protein